jgi:UDP-N-acetyl-D-glucosamine dehydrogenase
MISNDLAELIKDRRARVGIIGLGYVGLPLALAFVRAGFTVDGYDVDERHAALIQSGASPIIDVSDEALRRALSTRALTVSASADILEPTDVVLICVPTPLSKSRQPDLSYIESALEALVPRFGRGKLVILESTTYPGTTDEHLLGRLSAEGLVEGTDFFLAFSSERVDPGNRQFELHTIPKVVGGVSESSGALAEALYASVFDHVHRVSSARVAELSKLLENTFRNVNIALANEFKMICDNLGVNVWEVIEAAKTKPFGFLAFYPGPGIGGHCIPLDPQYLVFKSRLSGFEPRIVALADQINMEMPRYTTFQVMELLNDRGCALRGARVLAVGVTYKPDVPDLRESPALLVIDGLLERGADVRYVDPYVPSLTVQGKQLHGFAALSEAELDRADAIVVLSAHSAFDTELLERYRSKVLDTRNIMGPATTPSSVAQR